MRSCGACAKGSVLQCIHLLTLGAHAQRGLQYLVVCVCVSVCLSIKSHLTSGASVHPENTVAYSAGNGGQNICGVFLETVPFKSYGVKHKLKSQYASCLMYSEAPAVTA